MKKLILLTATAFTMMSAQAQDFKTVLTKTMNVFDTTMIPEVQVEYSNKISLISKKWDSEWAGHYYSAFSKAVLSYSEKDATKRDAYLDDADKELLDAVNILGKQTDETYVLGAMLANARMAVNPMLRYQKYGKIFSDDLEEAKELNPNNPRMYYLQGVSKFFTPKAFGGGKKNAQPYFEKAEGLFAKESSDDITKPYWGKYKNAYFLSQCKIEDKE